MLPSLVATDTYLHHPGGGLLYNNYYVGTVLGIQGVGDLLTASIAAWKYWWELNFWQLLGPNCYWNSIGGSKFSYSVWDHAPYIHM